MKQKRTHRKFRLNLSTSDALACSLAVRPERVPFEHQLVAMRRMFPDPKVESEHGWLLADDPGLGKTLTLLMVAKTRWLRQSRKLPRRPLLAIVPLSTLEVWRKEAQYVFHEPDCQVWIHYGGNQEARSKRLQAWATRTPRDWSEPKHEIALYITTHETVRYEEGSTILADVAPQFDAVLLDEGHVLHNAHIGTVRQNTAKTATELMKLVNRSERRYVATATPYRNELRDLITVAHFVHEGKGASPDYFLNARSDTSQLALAMARGQSLLTCDDNSDSDSDDNDDDDESWLVSGGCRKEMAQRLRQWLEMYCIRRQKADVRWVGTHQRMLPTKHKYLHHLIASNTELNHVRQIENKLKLVHDQWKTMDPVHRGALMPHILSLWTRLRQSCTSRYLFDADGPEQIESAFAVLGGDAPLPSACEDFIYKVIQESTKLRTVLRDIYALCYGCDPGTGCGNPPINAPHRTVVVISQYVLSLKLMTAAIASERMFECFAPQSAKDKRRQTKQPLRSLLFYGRLTSSARNKLLEEARDYQGPLVFFTSLRAGNVGIDMTFSSEFLFLDRWWNKATELQMEDRGHRFSTLARKVGSDPQHTNIHYYNFDGSVEDYQRLIQSRKDAEAMAFLGTSSQQMLAETRRICMEETMSNFRIVTAVEHYLKARQRETLAIAEGQRVIGCVQGARTRVERLIEATTTRPRRVTTPQPLPKSQSQKRERIKEKGDGGGVDNQPTLMMKRYKPSVLKTLAAFAPKSNGNVLMMK